jgi:hypothetical protein
LGPGSGKCTNNALIKGSTKMKEIPDMKINFQSNKLYQSTIRGDWSSMGLEIESRQGIHRVVVFFNEKYINR